jgi:prophage antirepressor-like protein
VLKDVCEVLGITNHRNVIQRLEKDDVHTMDITDNLNRLQNTKLINEAALYQVIMLSRKPEAKKFTDVFKPSVRRDIVKCKYCGSGNKNGELKCSSCGASIEY